MTPEHSRRRRRRGKRGNLALSLEADLLASRLESGGLTLAAVRAHHALLLRRGLLSLRPFHHNALARAYLRLGSPLLAASAAALLAPRLGAPHDRYSLPLIFKSAALLEAPRLPPQLHAAAAKRGLDRDVYTCSGIIACYGKCGDLRDAVKAFDEMAVKKIGSWNAIISIMLKCGHLRRAVELFVEMRKDGVRPDGVTLVGVMSACGGIGDVVLGEQVHKCVVQCGNLGRAGVTLSNAVIDMYGKCEKIEEVMRQFECMPTRDVSSWTSVMTALMRTGDEHGVLIMLERMRADGRVQPNRVTMLVVLSACAQGGMVDEGMQLLREMENGLFDTQPTVEHYGCIVDMLGKAGHLAEAKELIEKRMPMSANEVIYGALLGACEKYGDATIGQWVARKLIEMQPLNDGGYVVLSNILASKGMWHDAGRVRKLMLEISMCRNPGFSSFPNNTVH